MKVRSLVIWLAALTVPLAAQKPPSAAPPTTTVPPVEVRTTVTRTALWVGDPVTYAIELRCAPKVDILTDDLAAERLPLKGLELLGVEVERDATVPDRIVHRMRYRLVSYDIDAPAIGIGPIPVRYHVRQPGMRAEDVVPAGEVVVPAVALSLRSTIPEGMTAQLRDERPTQALPKWVALARPVGLGLVVVAAFPVALWAAGLVRRARRARASGPVRQTRKQRLAALEEIKALDVSSPAALREAYARLDNWVRSSLQQATGVPALALTPAEISTAVTRPPKAVRMGQVQEVLIECEQAKYAPDAASVDRWHTVLREAGDSMGADTR